MERTPLRAAPDRGRWLAGAAAVGLLAAGVAGLIVLRDDEPAAPADGGPAVSAPVTAPPATVVSPSGPLDTGSLLTTPLAADGVPFIAAPGYRLEYAVGLSLDEVVATIDQILVDPADLGLTALELDAPVGYRALPMRTGTDETAYIDARLVADGREVAISAQNTGAAGAFRSGALVESTENRVVDGVDVALRTQPEESGAYLADWFVGDWSFRVEGRSFPDEQAFLDVLATLELTSPRRSPSRRSPTSTWSCLATRAACSQSCCS